MCSFYGWTWDYALAMPAQQFFTSFGAAKEVYNRRMRDLCDVQSIALGNDKYFKEVRKMFQVTITGRTKNPNAVDYSRDPEGGRAALFAIFGDRNARPQEVTSNGV